MKQFVFISLACVVILMSCYTGRPISKVPAENNTTYNVEYLFEHEGCKVYRFRDADYYVYFTNCTGSVTAFSADSTKSKSQTIVKSQ